MFGLELVIGIWAFSSCGWVYSGWARENATVEEPRVSSSTTEPTAAAAAATADATSDEPVISSEPVAVEASVDAATPALEPTVAAAAATADATSDEPVISSEPVAVEAPVVPATPALEPTVAATTAATADATSDEPVISSEQVAVEAPVVPVASEPSTSKKLLSDAVCAVLQTHHKEIKVLKKPEREAIFYMLNFVFHVNDNEDFELLEHPCTDIYCVIKRAFRSMGEKEGSEHIIRVWLWEYTVLKKMARETKEEKEDYESKRAELIHAYPPPKPKKSKKRTKRTKK